MVPAGLRQSFSSAVFSQEKVPSAVKLPPVTSVYVQPCDDVGPPALVVESTHLGSRNAAFPVRAAMDPQLEPGSRAPRPVQLIDPCTTHDADPDNSNGMVESDGTRVRGEASHSL